MKPAVVLDVECYPNYFLVLVRSVRTGKTNAFELYDGHTPNFDKLRLILSEFTVVTFNGNSYDMPVVSAFLSGYDCEALKTLTDMIIKDEMKPWQIYRNSKIVEIDCDHIDLIEVAPGVQIGLKIYGGRLHSPKMQDLPIDPDQMITAEQRELLKLYCANDLDVTTRLYLALTEQLAIRRVMTSTYGVNLMSKSDAQIAEAVIVSELTTRLGYKPKKPAIRAHEFNYEAPGFINFKTDTLRNAFEIATTRPFTVKSNGVIEMSKELQDLKIAVGSTIYQMGMGGLHSTESGATHRADETYGLYDYDVTSYYPSIILNCELYPMHLGREFLDVYRTIVNERVAAKAAGDKVKADTLKIVVNGSFGKLGSPYSMLYAPKLMVQTTVTGQLSLLMLIERLEINGISVVSGNTDGIVIKCRRGHEPRMEKIVAWWEGVTGFTMESAQYDGLFSRDVNNYVAVKPDGKVKTKGCFAPTGLMKSPQNEICTDAVIEYLKKGTPIAETITSCRDIRKFLTVRRVTGGAVKVERTETIDDWFEIEDRLWIRRGDHTKTAKRKSRPKPVEVSVAGEFVGKVLRWYYSVDERDHHLAYKKNLNRVPKSEGAKVTLDLPAELPADIDYDWYIREATEMLTDLGAHHVHGDN